MMLAALVQLVLALYTPPGTARPGLATFVALSTFVALVATTKTASAIDILSHQEERAALYSSIITSIMPLACSYSSVHCSSDASPTPPSLRPYSAA